MYYVNKIVGYFSSPLSIAMAFILVGFAIFCFFDCAKGKTARKLVTSFWGFALVWLWIMSTGVVCRITGEALEKPWLGANGLVPEVNAFPTADLIVLLSGGMGANTNISQYAEMYMGADRVWQAARLYHAGKAPRIVLTGLESKESTVPLLKDLGVPEEAILVDNYSLNTEENAKYTVELLRIANMLTGDIKPKVLLVTSAFHMKRSMLLFQKYAPELEIIPAPSDFEVLADADVAVSFSAFLPNAGSLSRTSIHFRELIGYWGYKLLR